MTPMPRATTVTLLVACLGLCACGLPASALGRNTPQHHYLTEQKNRTDIPAHYELLTFAQFLALPAVPERYTAPDWTIVRAQTRRSVSLKGYIGEVIQAVDGATYGRPPEQGDLHVHLREARQLQCGVRGSRNRQIVTEVTPHFQPPTTGWSYEALLDLCQRQVRVRISGWLLHDYQHIKDVGASRASAWEIHPVTNIEVWDPGREEWQKFPSR
jgi:hypothetical protein